MKLTRIILSVFVGAVFECSTEAQGLNLENLVSLWTLNANVADNYGTNNGVFVGAAAYTEGPRAGIQAASLDGSSYIKAGTNAVAFDLYTPFSATAWIKGLSQDSAIIGKMLNGGAYTGWEMHVGTLTGNTNGANRLTVWLINNFGANYIQVNSPTVVLDNAWHHVAFTYDGSGLAMGVRIYVDGQDATGDTSADSLTDTLLNTVNLDIGCRQDGANHLFKGDIAEASVWSTNLSPAEINEIYQNG
ncbi:MAG: LamG domain-containing protein, partial [Candidatus Omnitrophica bacterium]|nr:LamG domain-containing protein [Candidatus Omnitrophota bacterium]